MKQIITSLFLLHFLFANAQFQNVPNNKGKKYYLNPVFAGDYPDPSILRDGNDYYMVHSSFEYYPGLLVWKSKDLINWTPVTNALHKYIGSVWAPDLAKYKNKYYIYFPANNEIFVVTADSVNGKWSEPVSLHINSIDPGHFVDDNGKRYLYFANGGYVPLSDDGLSVTGDIKHAYDGWAIPRNWTIECFCLEGPKVLKKGDYYYLTIAEGGTSGPATSHMIISARSRSAFGPWENSPYNPIVRTASGNEKWWSKGHGTIISDTEGKWWIVFHAYEKGFYNMGRQTLLLPVEWTNDGWPKIPGKIKDDMPVKRPYATAGTEYFELSDNFEGNDLKPQWKFFGEYDTARFHLGDNSVTMRAKGTSIGNSSPMLFIPSDHSYTVDIELYIKGTATGGLALFYNNAKYSGILADSVNVLVNSNGWQFVAEKNVTQKHVFLRIKNIRNTVDLYYSLDGKIWNKIENSFEVSGFNHNALGGYLSLRIGLCAIGEGAVTFKNFRYRKLRE